MVGDVPAVPDLTVKKQPQQERARATFTALVSACGRLLADTGYAAVTTNHIAAAADVGIASLYEYFPGKDAVVAQVAQQMLDRVTAKLLAAIPDVVAAPPLDAARFWLDRIYDAMLPEKELIAVFAYEFPYSNHLPAIRGMAANLLRVSQALRSQAGGKLVLTDEAVTLHLMIHLTRSTMTELVVDPPQHLTKDEILDALAARITAWAS